MVLYIFLVVGLCVAIDVFDILEESHSEGALREQALNLTDFFSPLQSYHDRASLATEKTYPWAAQVVHSRTNPYPYVCTASCVHDGVFMTAARCITGLKVYYTTVLYRSKQLHVRAFVTPSTPTSQQFDDIGFIVVEKTSGVTYQVAKLYPPNEVKRTDDNFIWFGKKKFAGSFKAVGYAIEKEKHKVRAVTSPYTLRELPVVVQIELCWNILTNNKRTGFRVPCYHSCNFATFTKRKGRCVGYLAVEGAVIINDKNKQILGVATWGSRYQNYELPVGFSVVNSKTFVEDLECAKKIRQSTQKNGNYQSLCKL